MSKKHTPRKGVMPLALKRYWAARRRGKASRPISPTRKNPRGYVLVICKGKQRLRDVGGKFAASGAAVIYPTPESVLNAAKTLKRKFAKPLKGWQFYSHPV